MSIMTTLTTLTTVSSSAPSANIQWQHEQGIWISYDPYIQKAIYQHLKHHKSSNIPPFLFRIGVQSYIIDFDKECQINTQTSTSKRVRVNIPRPPILSSNIIVPIAYENLPADEQCPLCLEKFLPLDKIVILKACNGHYFHKYCESLSLGIEEYICKTLQCPVCKKRYGLAMGNMPSDGQMHINKHYFSLAGFERLRSN